MANYTSNDEFDSEEKLEQVFDCTNLSEFITSVKTILPFRGYSESKFFLCEMRGIEFLTKLSFYKKSTPELYEQYCAAHGISIEKNIARNIDKKHKTPNKNKDAVNPHDAEVGILNILKKNIIYNNISPCILELLYYKKCDDVGAILPSQHICDKYLTDPPKNPKIQDIIYNMFCRHNDLVKANIAYKNFIFLVLEECDITFHDYIVHYVENDVVGQEIMRSLLFQIVYTMYAITKLYPKFRHGDLHTDNIMIKFNISFDYKPESPQFMIFHAAGRKFCVPYFGMICKIIDFGFASIPEEGIISYITRDRHLMFMRSENDLLFFLHHIYIAIGKYSTVVRMLDELDPTRSYKHFNTEYIRRYMSKIPTYSQMLQARIFNQYTNIKVRQNQIWHEYEKI